MREEFTECDKCERLEKCAKEGVVLDVRESCDIFPHYIVGFSSGCPKESEETKCYADY